MFGSCARTAARCDTTSMSNTECELAVDSCIQRHHIFKNIWTPTMGEQLPCRGEIGNNKDRYAVAILRDRTTVGHVPREISAACALFLQREGSIHCVVTGKRCFHLPHKHKSPKTAATTQRPYLLISTMNDFILADFNLAVGWSIRQTAKFNSLPKFPAIRYFIRCPAAECVTQKPDRNFNQIPPT